MKGKLLSAIAVMAVAVCAVVLHLLGPEFTRELHGGKLWPW
jgi:hypothetical protein